MQLVGADRYVRPAAESPRFNATTTGITKPNTGVDTAVHPYNYVLSRYDCCRDACPDYFNSAPIASINTTSTSGATLDARVLVS